MAAKIGQRVGPLLDMNIHTATVIFKNTSCDKNIERKPLSDHFENDATKKNTQIVCTEPVSQYVCMCVCTIYNTLCSKA